MATHAHTHAHADPSLQHGNLPTRSTSVGSDDDGVLGEDASEVTHLFSERLRAYKHACGYLENYVEATEKLHHHNAKEYEKVLKTLSQPLQQGEHFDTATGGVAGLFENIRTNTQGIANSHAETAKTLKGTVLPTFERLHTEIKNKTKELTKGAGKGAKVVDKARKDTQKHVELLGQHTAAFDSTGGKISAADDPYVLQRGIVHRLHKQVLEENNNRADLLEVQNSFSQFEAHIISVMQKGLSDFNTVVSRQADSTKQLYGDVAATSLRVPPDFEWNGFVRRNNNVLIDPHAPPRSVSNISFPNQQHRSTQPLIAGSLERKGKIMKRYDANYYVITPAKFLHEYKTDDDVQKDPSPELSLYLPDCVVGALDGLKFAVKGKDASKGKLAISMSHELQFKAHTPADAAKWYEVIRQAAGQVSTDLPTPDSPIVGGSGEGFGPGAAGVAGAGAGLGAVGTTPHLAGTQAAPLHTTQPAVGGLAGQNTLGHPGTAGLQSGGLPPTGVAHTGAPIAGVGAPVVGTGVPLAGTGAPLVGTGAPLAGTGAPIAGSGVPYAAPGAQHPSV